MRTKTILISLAGILLLTGLIIFAKVLAAPRELASPEAVIHLVDANDAPMPGLAVTRWWSDHERDLMGYDQAFTDSDGICRFTNVPVKIGWLTGIFRSARSLFSTPPKLNGIAKHGSTTRIYVSYPQPCQVWSKDKPTRHGGEVDEDGVGIYVHADPYSYTLATLSFPPGTKKIDYTLSSSLRVPGK